ncbi:DUF1700 domain-containing protein [Dellaglioa sp. BT-FLS60]
MNDYLDEFSSLLVQLDEEERHSVIEFYREYLLDAGINEYKDCVTELGMPKQLARKTLADYSIHFNENLNAESTHRQKSRANIRTIWLVLLALLAAPTTIPVIFAIFAILAVFGVMIFAFVITALCLLVAIVGTTVVMIIAGIWVISHSLWTGLFYIGFGMTLLGLGLIVIPLIIWVITLMIQVTTNAVQRLYYRFIKRNRAEKGGDYHETQH